MKTRIEINLPLFEVVGATDANPGGDYLVCRDCKQRVGRGLISVSNHMADCDAYVQNIERPSKIGKSEFYAKYFKKQ